MAAAPDRMKRWFAQKWVLDNIIRVIGVEWDQGRIAYSISIAGSADGTVELRQIASRVRRWSDIHREYLKVAMRKEKLAKASEEEGHYVTSREHYFWASIFYAFATWPIHDDNHPNLVMCHERKNHCYDKVIRYAPHPMERVEIPFEGKSIAAILHKPSGSEGRKLPWVISIPGMDVFKELMHPLYGDKFLERGFGVLSVDGPGIGESLNPKRKIPLTEDNFAKAGRACIDYLKTRKDVDPENICVYGVSMGSFWAVQVASYNNEQLRATAVSMPCFEPGHKTLLNSASPSFKMRYMFMTNIYDEKEFDAFASKLSVKGLGRKITKPFMIVAGEDDELAPITDAYAFFEELAGPKKMLTYEGEIHALPNVYWLHIVADFLHDRVSGKPMTSDSIYVDTMGREVPGWTPFKPSI
ncbi:MAG: alpha/beta hydrolase [Candidatus Caldarchaeum sp.]